MPQSVLVEQFGETWEFPDEATPEQISGAVKSQIATRTLSQPKPDIALPYAYDVAKGLPPELGGATDPFPAEASESKTVTALKALPRAIGAGFEEMGNVARGVVADVGAGLSILKQPEGKTGALPPVRETLKAFKDNLPAAADASGNILAALKGEPLPIDATISEASKESVTAATVAHLSQSLAASAPMVASLGGLPGAAQKLAVAGFTVDMMLHAPKVATELGAELGKPPDEQDQNKIASLISEAAQITGFSALGGAHLGRAGVEAYRLRQANAPETAKVVEEIGKNDLPKTEEVKLEPSTPMGEQPAASGVSPVRTEPLNPGGAFKDLPPEIQAKDQGVAQREAWKAQMMADLAKAKETPSAEQGAVEPKASQVGESNPPSITESVTPEVTEIKPEPEIIGMGGAVPSEFVPPKQFKTSVKNATVDAERKSRGLPPMMETVRRSNQSAWDEAMAKIDDRPESQDALIAELAAEPRAVTPVENAMLLHRRIELRNEYEKALKRWKQAFEDNDMVRAAEESQQVKGWSAKLSDFEDITKSTGAESGRSLQARKMMAREDYTLAQMELRAMESKGRNLTDAEHLELMKAHEKITELENRIERFESEREVKDLDAVADTAFKDVAAEAAAEPKISKVILDIAEKIVSGLESRADAARLRLKDKFGRTSSGVDPTILLDLAEVGAAHIARGGLEFTKWSGRMITEFGEGVKPYLEQAYDKSKQLIDEQASKFGEPEKVKRAVKKLDEVEAITAAKESLRAKIAKGEDTDITPLVQKLAKQFWKDGIREREPMIDALHNALKEIIPDFTRDQTKRAFSGYGDYTPISKESLDVGLRDLRGQTQQVLKLEALQSKKPLERTGVERRVPSDEERRLIKQVNELKRRYGVVVTDPATQLRSALQSRKTYYEHRISDLKHEISTKERSVKTKTPSPTDPELEVLRAEADRLTKEHKEIFGDREMTDEQRLKMAVTAAEKNQVHWQERLEQAKQGNFAGKPAGRKITSPELEAIKAQTEAVKEQVQELKDLANPKKTPEEIALQSLKTRMKTRTAELRGRTARGDFAKKERKSVPLDTEGNKLKAELDIAKEQFEAGLEKDQWAKMSVFQKSGRVATDIYDAARALMTTGELSFILRQGKVAALSRPIQTAKALPNMFRALLGNAERARAIDLEVLNHPDAPAAKAAKLHIVDEKVPLSRQEEILMGRLVGRIPVLRNFNQAAHVFLNKVRFDMWSAMRKSMSKSGTPTLAEDKQIAMFVNEATGRGSLGKLEPAALPLARIMFSPRYFASRLQLATGHSLWGGTARTRRVIATEYARALIGLALYYAGLKMFFSDPENKDKGKVELDPRSSDFGKVQIGDSRIDPLAGLSQVATFASRTASGQTKTIGGEIKPIRGKDVKFGGDKWTDVAARFARGKLHPIPSTIANLFDGTDLGGEEATIANQAGNMVAPITYVDIYQALKEQGLDDGAALGLLAILGEGMQTFNREGKFARAMSKARANKDKDPQTFLKLETYADVIAEIKKAEKVETNEVEKQKLHDQIIELQNQALKLDK